MALMTEERRKEMEEEMNRFELEIAAPGGDKSTSSNEAFPGNKQFSPPPPPPAVATLLPEVLAKPPPPPPSSSPPLHSVLRPPPPPPPPVLHSQPQAPSIRFIPHQLQRPPARPPPPPPPPPPRPTFIPMGAPPMAVPTGHFPSPAIGAFMPPMPQPPPVGPSMPHMPLHPGSMGMPHQMENLNMGLPMPPGFCPPGPPLGLGPVVPCSTQSFMPNSVVPSFDAMAADSEAVLASSENSTIVAAAPAIYAAPFVKNEAEISAESINTSISESTTTFKISTAKNDRPSIGKTADSSVGPTALPNEETVPTKKKEKKKKIIRMAGGQAWEDNSLLDWDTDDFRIFCGDLGNDVTDEVLIRAFSKFPSFVKAKVIRDKRTNKTKGYGFVSFKDPQDFIKAMREMNGRYVGSRPIKLRKSTWKDRNIDLVKKKQREKEKLGLL